MKKPLLRKYLLGLCAVCLLFISAADAAIVINPSGNGSGYDEANMKSFRSTNVAKTFDVYALTHAGIQVGHHFKVDGDKVGLDVAVPVNTAATGARFAWVYNGCHGTGSSFPRPRLWSRYTADDEITISRGYDGQNFPAWVQGIDLSGLND